jgi:hypothetical protein
LLILLLLLQLSSNTVQSPSQALLPDHVPEGQRGAAAGWKSALEILAFVFGRQISGRLVGGGEVLAAVSVAAAVVAVAVLIASRTIRRMPPVATATSGAGFSLRRAFAFDRRRYPSFGPWFVNRVLVWGGFLALNTFLLFFVIDVLRLPEARAQRFVGDLSALMGVGLILVACRPGGWRSHRPSAADRAAGVTAAAGTGLLWRPVDDDRPVAGGILGLSVGSSHRQLPLRLRSCRDGAAHVGLS